MKLYELPAAYESLMSRLTDGEITPDLEAEIGALDQTLQDKTINICKIMQELGRQAESAKKEAERLEALSEVRIHATERLKEYLKTTLEALGMTKLETDLFKIRVCKNSRPSIMADAYSLPKEYQRVRIEVDGVALYEAWKAKKE